MDIRPIHNDTDHEAALRAIEQLWNAPPKSREAEELEILAILVEDYEKRRWPMPTASPVEILNHAISDMGHSQSELAQLVGSRSRASEILNGKRRLTIGNAHKISKEWHIPAELLIAPYAVDSAA